MNTLALKQYVKRNIKRSVVLNERFGSGSLMCGQANKDTTHGGIPGNSLASCQVILYPSDVTKLRSKNSLVSYVTLYMNIFVKRPTNLVHTHNVKCQVTFES